ncbi:MAG: group 1 truncated hemoglobin [Gemmataceae bacterium]|nr:group 1 truncated hemoglobin [Gemmataceae bacterium]
MRTKLLMAALLLAAAGGLTRADDKPLDRADLDKRIVGVVYEAAVKGTNLFNDLKNPSGHVECVRLYQGTLEAIMPLLDHRPKLQKGVKTRLETAAKYTKPADVAVELRTALDEILNEIAPPAKKDAKKLWDRLGGEKAVKAVVHDLLLAAAEDKKVNFTRDGKYPLDPKGIERLEKLLVEMVSEATGGPYKYSGKSMKEAHKGMGITDAEFDALAGHLVATLKKFKVDPADAEELVKAIAATRGDIVEKPKN